MDLRYLTTEQLKCLLENIRAATEELERRKHDRTIFDQMAIDELNRIWNL